MSCEGSRLQDGGLTLLLVSLPADSTTVVLKAKLVYFSRPSSNNSRPYSVLFSYFYAPDITLKY